MAQEHFRKGLKFTPGVDAAGRIGGAVQYQPACRRGDGRFQCFGSELEVVLRKAGGKNRTALRQNNHVRVRNPVRCWNDNLVTGVQGCHKRVIEHLFPASADRDL